MNMPSPSYLIQYNKPLLSNTNLKKRESLTSYLPLSATHLWFTIRSLDDLKSIIAVAIQDLVAGDVLVEEWAALHLHAEDRLPTRQFHLDVLVLILSGWVPAAG